LPALGPSEIEQRIAPFRADFVAETRKLVAGSLFTRDANPVLVQKVAYDMSLEPPAIAVASMRSLLSMDFAAVLPGVHVPVFAINSDLLPTDAARIRKSLPDFTLDVLEHSGHLPDAGSAGALQPTLLKDLDAPQRTRRSLSELVRVRYHRAATHLEPSQLECDVLRAQLRPSGREGCVMALLLQQ